MIDFIESILKENGYITHQEGDPTTFEPKSRLVVSMVLRPPGFGCKQLYKIGMVAVEGLILYRITADKTETYDLNDPELDLYQILQFKSPTWIA